MESKMKNIKKFESFIIHTMNMVKDEINKSTKISTETKEERKEEKTKRKTMKNLKTFNEATYSYRGEYEAIPFINKKYNINLKPGDIFHLSNVGKWESGKKKLCIYVGLTNDDKIVFHYNKGGDSVIYTIDIDDFYTKYIKL